MTGERGFAGRVAAVLATVEAGAVVSYGEVAAAAGSPGAGRAVGRVLGQLDDVPWWRVVRGDGRLTAPDAAEQARRLTAEGVLIRSGRAVPVAARPDAAPARRSDELPADPTGPAST